MTGPNQKNILEKFGILKKTYNFTSMDIDQHNEMVKQISELRNKLHKELVQESTCKNAIKGNSSHGVLHLKTPMIFGDVIIFGICCETGLLLKPDFNSIVPYQKLSTDELITLYEYVVENKNYSFTLNAELV